MLTAERLMAINQWIGVSETTPRIVIKNGIWVKRRVMINERSVVMRIKLFFEFLVLKIEWLLLAL